MKNRSGLAWGAAFGLLAVILGAMGAHALESVLTAGQLDSYKTAVRYQAWHALALVAISMGSWPVRFFNGIIFCWIAGIFLFSGSIYLLSTRGATGLEVSFLGPVTPVGGLTLIVGWFLLFLSAVRKPKQN